VWYNSSMDEKRLGAKNRCCLAMRENGIEDASSYDGVKFCVYECPYPDYCKLEVSELVERTMQRVVLSKKLRKLRVPLDDIARIIGVDRVSVKRYLKTPDGLRGGRPAMSRKE